MRSGQKNSISPSSIWLLNLFPNVLILIPTFLIIYDFCTNSKRCVKVVETKRFCEWILQHKTSWRSLLRKTVHQVGLMRVPIGLLIGVVQSHRATWSWKEEAPSQELDINVHQIVTLMWEKRGFKYVTRKSSFQYLSTGKQPFFPILGNLILKKYKLNWINHQSYNHENLIASINLQVNISHKTERGISYSSCSEFVWIILKVDPV